MMIRTLWLDDEFTTVPYELTLASSLGCEVTKASTGEEALRLTAQTRFDLVIIDLILPKDEYHRQRGQVDADTGIRLLAAVRDPSRRGATPSDVRVLVATAVVSDDKKALVLPYLSCPDDYLTKPFSLQPRTFEETLRRVARDLDAHLDAERAGGIRQP